MGANDDLREVAEAAELQWGLITTAQAGMLGVSTQQTARLARRGSLQKVRHGVYRTAGSPYESIEDLRALWLSLDSSRWAADRLGDENPGVYSHRSAAVIHKLGNVDADRPDLLVQKRRRSRQDDARFRVRSIHRGQWETVDGLPVTSVPVTVGDLAADRTDGDHLAAVVRDALLVGVDPEKLAAALAPHADSYGADGGQTLIDVLILAAGVPEATLRLAQARISGPVHELESGPLSIRSAAEMAQTTSSSLTSVAEAAAALAASNIPLAEPFSEAELALRRLLDILVAQPRIIERARGAKRLDPPAADRIEEL